MHDSRDLENTKKRPIGRPKKSELSAASRSKGKRGRPKGDAAIMNEYRARMLASPKSEYVLSKVYEVALDDSHKHQAACMKMIMDRILPVAAFEKEVKAGKGVPQITVNIKGVDGVEFNESEGEVIEHDD